MDEQTREIRQILNGRYLVTEDGRLAAVPKGERRPIRLFQGHTTGRTALRILGISHRSDSVLLPNSTNTGKLEEVMKTMGRLVSLKETEDVTAGLCPCQMAAPVLLVAKIEGDRLDLTAYTPRGIFAHLANRACTKRLKDKMTDQKDGDKEKREKKGIGTAIDKISGLLFKQS